MAFEYIPYKELAGRPNVIVDGSAGPGTVLTLSHWPGTPVPPGLEADLSAQMAFHWLDRHERVAAEAVSNNHFDQDGLVSVFALVHPEAAQARRDVLIDLAGAGDFATYRDRRAARASMVLAAHEAEQDPYAEWLDRLAELVDHPELYKEKWEEEDADLTRSEEAIRSGAVAVEEHPDLDLTVLRRPELHLGGGHRFAHLHRSGLHPMAVNNAASGFVVATVAESDYRVEYRYESWVQYRSRRPRARRDLTSLAAELNQIDPDGEWTFTGVSDLAPQLVRAAGPGPAFGPDDFLARLLRHLRDGPPAWDPYPAG